MFINDCARDIIAIIIFHFVWYITIKILNKIGHTYDDFCCSALIYI